MKQLEMKALPDVVTQAESVGPPIVNSTDNLKAFNFDDTPLSPEWVQRAQEELQEKAEWRDRDIQALRDLVEAEENLVCSSTDEFLLKFLRAKKFDYEKSFKMVQRYCAMRSRSPQNFSKSIPSLAKDILDSQLQTVLPHRDAQARRVMIFRAGKWDTTTTSPEDIFSTNFMCLELMAKEQKTQISGIVALIDMEDFGWDHMMQLSVDYIRNVVSLVQNSFPIRFREIHIINESYLFDMTYALVKPFLSEKIKNRIRFHGSDLQGLHKNISPSILPRDYGGEQEPFDNIRLKEALENMEDYFKELKSFGYTDNIVPSEVYEKETHPFPAFCLSGQLPE